MSPDYGKNINHLEEMRSRLASGKLTEEDVSALDQLIVGHLELHKAMSTASEKIGDKVVLAKLPFGVDLVK